MQQYEPKSVQKFIFEQFGRFTFFYSVMVKRKSRYLQVKWDTSDQVKIGRSPLWIIPLQIYHLARGVILILLFCFVFLIYFLGVCFILATDQLYSNFKNYFSFANYSADRNAHKRQTGCISQGYSREVLHLFNVACAQNYLQLQATFCTISGINEAYEIKIFAICTSHCQLVVIFDCD